MARPRQVTDEQILSAMRAAVLEHGAGVSLDVVAARLKVTSPALLKRFGTRQQLMLQSLQPPGAPAWLKDLEKGPDARPLDVQLTEHFERLWTYFSEVIPCVAALRESGVPHEKIFEGKTSAPIHAIRTIAGWLEKARAKQLIETRSCESVATAILGALQTRAFTAHVAKVHYSTRSNREYLEDLVQLFVRALTCPSKPRKPSRSEVQ